MTGVQTCALPILFTSDLIQTYISYKRENEILPIQIRPHPYEFALYYDV